MSGFLKFLGWACIVAGPLLFIIVIASAQDERIGYETIHHAPNMPLAVAALFGGLVSGALLVGFSELLDAVQRIAARGEK